LIEKNTHKYFKVDVDCASIEFEQNVKYSTYMIQEVFGIMITLKNRLNG